MSGAHLVPLACQRVFHGRADDLVAIAQPLSGFGIIGGDGAKVCRSLDKRQRQAVNVQRNRVIPDHACRLIAKNAERECCFQRAARDQPPRRQTAIGRRTSVTVRAQYGVGCQRGQQRQRIAQAPAAPRHDAGEGLDGGWRQLDDSSPRADGFAHSHQVGVLQIAQATVDDFQTVGAGSRAPIGRFHQSHAQAPPGRGPRDGGALNAATHHKNIKVSRAHLRQVSGAGRRRKVLVCLHRLLHPCFRAGARVMLTRAARFLLAFKCLNGNLNGID